LTLVYQPIVNLETDVMVGAEALLRWTNEDGEVVSPDTFIGLAEDKGLIKEVTEYVIQRAICEMRNLLEDRDFYLTVNITWQDLAADEFVTFLQATLAEAELDPSAVGLELTERSTLMHQEGIANISRLRGAGHAIYIDDFGTGYSSLAYLRDLSVDFIKIDRAFTKSIGTDAVTETIIPQILRMAEQLGLAVVVEGIETDAQAKYFRAAGKGILGQGWFLGRPVAAAELSALRVVVHR
jgi:sensor c-di-GMP phosphodiesterase-like protein